MNINQFLLENNKTIPNNPSLPVLFYRAVFDSDIKNNFSQSFAENGWGGHWINGVYDYHHYHSTAHEVLGVISGEATAIIGGPGGKELHLEKGDLVILPAGTGHCRKYASNDFSIMGAYPHGQEDYDICTENDNPEEKKMNIQAVPLPEKDPVSNSGGILKEAWY